jgi:hypothetical protein
VHGSEVAFWPNAASHFAGVIQTVPDMPGTEIILESTANGVGGEFHERWQMAEAGQSDYEPIFIPWFWQEEYRRPIPSGFVLTEEEGKYATAYGLDPEQIAWRRAKISELKDPLLFMQEYPANAAEAFQMTGHDSYIPSSLVMKARKTVIEGFGPLIIGADPSGGSENGDRFSLAWRKGQCVPKVVSRLDVDPVEGANWIKRVIDEDDPARVFVDVGGVGVGVVSILRSWGEPYASIVKPVNFGSAPQGGRLSVGGGPSNRRSEMWMRSKEWLEDVLGADIPDSDALHADACAPTGSYNMKNELVLESKQHMRSRQVRSPDEWDAVALTFAEPVGIPKTVAPKAPKPFVRGARNQSWMK